MKVLVPIKRVIDYNVVVQIHPDCPEVVTEHVKMSINPFDEIALEEAITLSEQKEVSEVIVCAVGTELTTEQLRQALAMGAHNAIQVLAEEHIAQDPLCVATVLHAIVRKENINCVFMGKQAIDNDCNQTGQMLAALLQWPQATFASKIILKDDVFDVFREVDGGTDVLQVPKQSVITVDLRLNQPRYITLPKIMMAKSKPLQTTTLLDLDLDLRPQLQRIALEYPQARAKGRIFSDIESFMDAIQQDGVLS